MHEITYEENEFLNHTPEHNRVHYDFSFGNRYDVFHWRKGKVFEYIALDRTTGRTSWILERKTPMDASEYPDITPEILYSIKYTGDPRYKGASSYTAMELMDLIFKVLMPRHGYSFREQQYEMAHSIFHGLNYQKVTLCEAEVGTGKTMAYLVACCLVTSASSTRPTSCWILHPVVAGCRNPILYQIIQMGTI